MSIDADRLRVLVEVAHAGSIAAAARRMSFTASALSQQLAKLERELGCRLVDRGQHGIELTEAGRVLVAHGEIVLGELRTAEQTVRSLVGEQAGRLSIGTFATAGQTLVPDALAAFRAGHPDVQLALQDLEPPLGYGLVISRDLDLLITHCYRGVKLPSAGGVRRGRLLTDVLRLVLPAGHPRADGRAPRLAELAEEDWISGAVGVANRVTLEAVACAAGFEPHVAYETQDYQVTLALLGVGLGIALVPASVLARADLSQVAVRDLQEPAPVREIFVVHRARPLPLVAEMVALLHRSAVAIGR
jgi:DNA-binding transcriptional LysR family regulator